MRSGVAHQGAVVADKRCDNGHFIDESWDLCPYCPADQSEAEIPVVRPTRFGTHDAVTASPSPASANQPATERSADAQPADRAPERRAISAPTTAPRRDLTPASVQVPPMERTIAVQRLDANAQPKRYVVGWLIGLSGESRGESYPVRMGRNVLGRDRRSDILINDDQASAHHADLVFRPEERRFILMDHNSTNGTYVNEGEIEPRRDLASQDIIRVGSHRFLFVPLCHDGFYWDDEGVLK
ncbi:MAG: FHA domain-containing protein [Acidobacteriota bacterium]